MTEEYRYRCTRCDDVTPLPTAGEKHVTVGCPTCDDVRQFARLWACAECGRLTTTPKWPRDIASADDGPLCNRHYGQLLINNQ